MKLQCALACSQHVYSPHDAGEVKSWFPQLREGVRLALVQHLCDESHVRELEKALTYALDTSPPVRA
jgi:hypothetical protein